MTSLYLVGGGVAVIGLLIAVVVWVSRSAGRSKSEAAAAKRVGKRREAFDDAASTPLESGDNLVARLRDMRARRLRDDGR